MQRRSALKAIAAGCSLGVTALAGCIEDEDSDDPLGGGNGSPTATPADDAEPTPTPSPDGDDGDGNGTGDGDGSPPPADGDVDVEPPVTDAALSEEEGCPDIDVTFESAALEVMGCVTGNTSCHVPAIESATVEDGRFTLVVVSSGEGDPEDPCLQVITEGGYRVRATFEDEAPGVVEVVHDDVGGRRTVATVEQ